MSHYNFLLSMKRLFQTQILWFDYKLPMTTALKTEEESEILRVDTTYPNNRSSMPWHY